MSEPAPPSGAVRAPSGALCFVIIRPTVKILKRLLLATVALLAVLVLGVLPYWFAGIATTRKFQFPDKENAGLTPASFQLPFEDVAFATHDGIELKGWWVPAAEPRGTVVLVHGLNRSRIEMVRKAPFAHEQGWNVLLFDLRHHGESGGSSSSFGWFEKHDAAAAVAFARARTPGPVVLWGVSLGGATATLAAAQDATIAGLVCDSSYRSLRDTVWHHMGLVRHWVWWGKLLPAWAVAPQAVFWMGQRGGFNPDDIDIVRAAARLDGRPCLFVCNAGDRRMPQDIARELQAAAGREAQLLVVDGKSHGGAYRDGTAAYQQAVKGVLRRAEARNTAAQSRVPGGLETQPTWANHAHTPS